MQSCESVDERSSLERERNEKDLFWFALLACYVSTERRAVTQPFSELWFMHYTC